MLSLLAINGLTFKTNTFNQVHQGMHLFIGQIFHSSLVLTTPFGYLLRFSLINSLNWARFQRVYGNYLGFTLLSQTHSHLTVLFILFLFFV